MSQKDQDYQSGLLSVGAGDNNTFVVNMAWYKQRIAALEAENAEITDQRDTLCEHLLVMLEVQSDHIELKRKLICAATYWEKCIQKSDLAIAASQSTAGEGEEKND